MRFWAVKEEKTVRKIVRTDSRMLTAAMSESLTAVESSRAAVAPKVTLYTHTACPFAQRVWIALEHKQLPFERKDVNLYGSGGFDKRALKQVEEKGGLTPPKGYIPVLSIDDGTFRESDHCVKMVEALPGPSLEPQDAKRAEELITLCNGELNRAGRAVVQSGASSSAELDACLRQVDAACADSEFLGGDAFSTVDACLLPFLWRIETELTVPKDCANLRKYLARAKDLPCFAKTIVGSWWWWW